MRRLVDPTVLHGSGRTVECAVGYIQPDYMRQVRLLYEPSVHTAGLHATGKKVQCAVSQSLSVDYASEVGLRVV